MSSTDIVTIVITAVGLLALCLAFTFLFAHYYRSETNKVVTGQKDIYLLDDLLMESKKKHKAIRRVFSIIGKIISYIVLIVIIAFFSLALVNRVNGRTTFLNGQSLVVIATGSMSEKNEANMSYLASLDDQFNAYDIIGISEYSSSSEVKQYDVVAYKSKDGTMIVHRIREMETVDGELHLHTRGDANNADDASYYPEGRDYLLYTDIIGHYNGTRIQGAGLVIYFLQSAAGIMTIVSIIYCFLMYDILSRRYQKAVANRSNEISELVNFDLDDEGALDEAEVTYHEALIYKGKAYYFADNQFVEKGDAPLYQEPVYMRRKDNGHNEIYVKDEDNGIHHISGKTLADMKIDEADIDDKGE